MFFLVLVIFIFIIINNLFLNLFFLNHLLFLPFISFLYIILALSIGYLVIKLGISTCNIAELVDETQFLVLFFLGLFGQQCWNFGSYLRIGAGRASIWFVRLLTWFSASMSFGAAWFSTNGWYWSALFVRDLLLNSMENFSCHIATLNLSISFYDIFFYFLAIFCSLIRLYTFLPYINRLTIFLPSSSWFLFLW